MNLADETQVNNQANKEKLKRSNELAEMRSVLNTQAGRNLIWRYLDLCGVFKSSMSQSSQIYFNEGRRDVGLKLLADITEANEESLIQMMRENKEKK